MIKKKLMSLILLTNAFLIGPSSSVNKQNQVGLDELSRSEMHQIAEGLDLTRNNNTLKLGTGYSIFDSSSSEFVNAITVTERSSQSADSAIGNSMMDISSQYDAKFGLGTEIQFTVPVALTSFAVGANFDRETSTLSGYVADEYYEYYEVRKKMKLVKVDWNSITLESALTSQFKVDLAAVSNLNDAQMFLAKYGTHVFDNYYFGGILTITRYIASEKNIHSEYEANNLSISLKMHIENAIGSIANNKNYNMVERELNTSTTVTNSLVNIEGGNNLNAITPTDLFTFKQEYMSQYETGYIYQAWLNSIARGELLRVVDAERPLAVWDLLMHHGMVNHDIKELLRESSELLAYSSYAENSLALSHSPNYISSLDYYYSNYQNNLKIKGNNFYLPPGVTATINYGEILTDNNEEEDLSVVIKTGSDYGKIEDKLITIYPDTKGNRITFGLRVKDVEVITYTINIDSGRFTGGYGSETQPYLIATHSEWMQFINNSEYYDQHFQLINDINLQGRIFQTGGSDTRRPFTGSLNGNGYEISNATIKTVGTWNYVGLFGINKGAINHLRLESVTVLNDQIKTASHKGSINAGILAGLNGGVIDKVSITNSSIRIVSQLDDSSNLNIGGLVGRNQNYINLSLVKDSHITGITYFGTGYANVGGLIGSINAGTVSNSYTARNETFVHIDNTKLVVTDNTVIIENEGPKGEYRLGGLFGYAEASNIRFSVSYKNTFNQNKNEFGYVGGNIGNNTTLSNIFYEGLFESAVNGASANGAKNYGSLTLEEIGNAEWHIQWEEDENSNPVLKWEVQNA